jgi:hypothetical protein
MTVTVTSGVLSGPVAVAVPPNVAQQQYTICQATAAPVTITVQ